MKGTKSLFRLGAIAFALISMTILAGCDTVLSEGYTFEFKVRYDRSIDWWGNGKIITQIDFINGPSRGDQVLVTKTIRLGRGEMLSSLYRVSGFTNKEGDGRIFGILATFEDNSIIFRWSSGKKNGDKILVEVSDYYDGWSFSLL